MIDDNTPTPTPMDRKIDQPVAPSNPPREHYSNSGKDGLPIADIKEPLTDTDPSMMASWTIAEVERAIARNVLKPSSTKIDQFAQVANRRSDMRLRLLSKQLGVNLSRDHLQEMTRGPAANRVRDFDIQSQTMRMVSANASMGTYQFQKTLTLPYMRKSLALGYQKVSLLKSVVGGIGSLEKAVVSKLEAIKINTAAAAPRKQGYLKRLIADIGFLNTRRVASNFSNLMMNAWEKRYKQYVTPALRNIHSTMQDTSVAGGVNGVRRSLTNKLNSLQNTMQATADKSPENASRLDKIKSGTAGIAAKVVGGTSKAVQKIQFGEERNRKLTNFLSPATQVAAGFNPFSGSGQQEVDAEESDSKAGTIAGQTLGDAPRLHEGSISKLTESFKEWRKEYRSDNDNIIKHLSQINGKMDKRFEDAGMPASRKMSVIPRPPVEITPTADQSVKPAPLTSNPVPTIDDIVASAPSVPRSKTLTDMLSGPLEAKVNPDALPPLPGENSRPESPTIGERMKKARDNSSEKFAELASELKGILSPLTTRSGTLATAAASGVPITAPKPSTLNPFSNTTSGDAPLDRSFFNSLFEKLGARVTDVSKSVVDGNQDRTKFEKVQTKWKEVADRLRPKEVRKGSYEELMSDRKKGREGSFLSRTKDRVKDAAKSTAEKLASGDLIGAAGGLGSDILNWAKDEVGDAIGDKVRETTGDLYERGKRRASTRGRRALRRFGRGRRGILGRAARSLGGVGEEIAEEAAGAGGSGGRRSLGRKALSLFGRGAKGLGRAGGGLLTRGAGAVLKGGFGLAKASVPAVVTGFAADYANDWINKNTSGGVKRLGNTATEAAKWGSMGATVGSIVPGVGTGIGGALGAGLGAVIANADILSQGLSTLGGAAATGGKFLWTSLFGQDAKIDNWGKVKQKEKPSLLGNFASSIFGADAVYAKSGDIVREGKTGLIPWVRKGFDKFLFGDLEKDGSYKKGSSVLSQLAASLSTVMDDFKKDMLALPGKISEGLSNLGDGARSTARAGYDWMQNAAQGIQDWGNNTFQNGASSKPGAPVADAKAIAEQVIPGITVTSHQRKAGQAGKAGSRSWHVKSGAAIDVRPVKGMSFNDFKRKFTDAGYTIIEAIDETSPATMAKTGATGPHWHIVLGQPNAAPNANAGYSGPGGAGNWSAAGSNPAGGTGPLKGGFVSGDAKSKFGDAVGYLTKKGWSRTAAIGIAANLFGESNLNTSAFNGKGGGQGAKGIAQWRGERITEVERRSGKPIEKMSLHEQLDAVDFELRDGKHVTGSNSIPNGKGSIVETLNNAPNMESVVQQLVHRYERPAVGERDREVSRRIQTAQGIMGSMGNDATKPAQKTTQASTPAAKTSAAAKQMSPTAKAPAAVAKKETPKATPVVDNSGIADLTNAIKSWTTEVKESTSKTSTSKTNTIVNAPITNVKNGSSGSSVSLAKTRVRTGG